MDMGYSVLWNSSTAKQVWLVDCSEQELRKKAHEIWDRGGRFLRMQAYVVQGQVRYNCLWNFNGIGQVWNPNCTEAHFRKRTGELWKWARPAQVQAFVVGDEVRYSCLWNAGTHDQVWNQNCTEAHFRKTTDELWKWARPAQVQAFVINNEVRYSCLWNAGKHGQVWNPNCDEAHLRKTTDGRSGAGPVRRRCRRSKWAKRFATAACGTPERTVRCGIGTAPRSTSVSAPRSTCSKTTQELLGLGPVRCTCACVHSVGDESPVDAARRRQVTSQDLSQHSPAAFRAFTRSECWRP